MAKDKRRTRTSHDDVSESVVDAIGTSKKVPSSSTGTQGRRSGTKEKAGVRRMLGDFYVVSIGQHTSYVKQHQGEDDRTMFMVNLPVDATEENVKALYAGTDDVVIEEVRLWKGKGVAGQEEDDDEENGGKAVGKPALFPLPSLDPRMHSPFLPTSTSAHITFSTDAGLQKALLLSTLAPWQSASSLPSGLSFLLQRHQCLRPPLASVRTHADSVIGQFEWRLKHPQKKRSRIEAVSQGPNGELLDADGFTIVQSTGKYGRTTEAAGGASVRVARSRAQNTALAGRRRRGGADDGDGEPEGREKKKKKIELEDFYRFQRREAKREELADLRAKFQADQEKIKKLKANRTFKPY